MNRGFYVPAQALLDSINPRGRETGNSPEVKKS
jgi:hypothetical protein